MGRQSDSTLAAVAAELAATLQLDVDAVSRSLRRVDVSVNVSSPLTSPGAEHDAMLRVAEAVWRRSPLDTLADTVAVSVSRVIRRDSVMERNTYFYYRAEHVGRRQESRQASPR